MGKPQTDNPNGDLLVDARGLGRRFVRSLTQARKLGVRQILSNLFGRTGINEELANGEFWAVRNATFQLRRGESVAVLGLNGAGKSTLLRMVGGLLVPSAGSVTVRGKVDSIVDLGSGFHPGLSGRENVYIRCAMAGLSARETSELFDSIVEFAELQDAIDMPLRSYSSGMYARLGFATAVFGRPDVLLIDEILSVGDFAFRQKCLDKMNELRRQCGILFVSHSFSTVLLFCQRGIVLEKGEIVFDGEVGEAIERLEALHQHRPKTVAAASASRPPQPDRAQTSRPPGSGRRRAQHAEHPIYGPLYFDSDKVADFETCWTDGNGRPVRAVSAGGCVGLDIRCRFRVEVKHPLAGIRIWNEDDVCITSFASDVDSFLPTIDPDGSVRMRLELDGVLNADTYHAVLAIHDGPRCFLRQLVPPLEISGAGSRRFGVARIPHRWSTPPADGGSTTGTNRLLKGS